jgi:hypothetical protein
VRESATRASPARSSALSTAARSADLGDGCFLSAAQRIVAPLTDPASGPCAAQYPVGMNTRLGAGEKLSLDVMKCRLRPLDFPDYPVTFTADEQAQLRAAFPTGVCDNGRAGVEQRAPNCTWRDSGDRP